MTLVASFRAPPDRRRASSDPPTPQADQAAGGPMRLTRTQAEQLAIKNNPRISVGRLLALAQHQVYRETRRQNSPISMAP